MNDENAHVGVWLPMRIVRAHMGSQRRSPSECLFAEGILALVRTFASVRSSVPRKRARVTKRLVTSRILAAVRFLPSVYPHMYVQCGTLSDMRIHIRLHAAEYGIQE